MLLCSFSITNVYTLFIRMPKVFSIFVQLASIQVHLKVKFPTSNTGRLVLKKNLFFCVGEYTEYGFDQQRLIWYVFRLWGMVFSHTPQAKNIPYQPLLIKPISNILPSSYNYTGTKLIAIGCYCLFTKRSNVIIIALVSRCIFVALPFLLKFVEINVTFLVSLFGIFQSRGSF